MQFQGKYCTIKIPLNQNPIEIDGTPTWPTEWPTLPSTLPTFPTDFTFPTAAPTAAPTEGTTGEWSEWTVAPSYALEAKAAATLEKFSSLQAYVFGITGMGEPVDTR